MEKIIRILLRGTNVMNVCYFFYKINNYLLTSLILF